MRGLKFFNLRLLALLFFCILCAYHAPLCWADTVKLKMIVANPSETDEKNMPVQVYLPKDVKPEDIIDKGGFRIEYDFEKSLYLAYQEVTLKPKETITLELGIKDIWVIPDEEIKSLKEYTQSITASLKKSEYYNQSKSLSDSIVARLDKIAASQGAPGVSTEQKISDYEVNSGYLKEIKRDIGVLEDLVIELKGPAGLPAGELKGENTSVSETAGGRGSGLDTEKLGTIKFNIVVTNIDDKESAVPVKYYLPSEVRQEDVVDLGSLEFAYDSRKGIHYVFKDAVNLGPGEKKDFEVTVKDIWVIPQERIQVFKSHVDKLMAVLAESEYKEQAKSLADKIASILDEINNIQKITGVSVERHIGDYRLSLAEFDEARRYAARLEKLVVQSGGNVSMANDTGKMRGAKGMEMVGKSIFRGKAPDAATSWKIIWVILTFLGIVSFLFFILWWTQVKKSENKKKENVQSNNTES